MNTRIIGVLAVLVLLVVACSAEARSSQSEAVPVGEVAQALEGDDLLELKVWVLETRLDALRWTEEDAIAVTKNALREGFNECGDHSHKLVSGDWTASGDCIFPAPAPVLDALSGWGQLSRRVFVRALLEDSEWSATYESGLGRWTVTGLRQPDDSSKSSFVFGFYVNERTGLVEGIPPR